MGHGHTSTFERFPGAQDENVFAGTVHRCAWQGCSQVGEHRAPKDRTLASYYLFCLDHARAYNAQWDYHRGLNPQQLETEIRSAATGDRPTWKLGTLGAGRRHDWRQAHDPFGFRAEAGFDPKKRGYGSAPPRSKEDAEQDRALKALDLSWPCTVEALKRRYKALVKKHHPDTNGGSQEAERRMKLINAAYQTLRTALATG